MEPTSTSSDVDLLPFWTEVDQIGTEYKARPQLDSAAFFWTFFSNELKRNQLTLDQVDRGVRTDGAFGGLAAQRFYERLDASKNAIGAWQGQDIGSVGQQFFDLDEQVTSANAYAQNSVQKLRALGIADHQPTLQVTWWASSASTTDVTDVLELMRARWEALQEAFGDMKARLDGISAAPWTGFGSRSAAPVSGDAYNNGVTLQADALEQNGATLMEIGTQPAAPGSPDIFAYAASGPLSSVLDRALIDKSTAAINFQHAMREGMTLGGNTLRGAAALFRHHDRTGYLELMQALG